MKINTIITSAININETLVAMLPTVAAFAADVEFGHVVNDLGQAAEASESDIMFLGSNHESFKSIYWSNHHQIEAIEAEIAASEQLIDLLELGLVVSIERLPHARRRSQGMWSVVQAFVALAYKVAAIERLKRVAAIVRGFQAQTQAA